MTSTAHVTQFVTMKQKLGYRFTTNAKVLTSFARFAAEEEFIHSGTVLAWASAASSQPWCVKRLHIVHAFALWMHAEDARHEVPPRDAFGPLSHRRPAPHLVSIPDIRKLLSAAHSMPPAGTINPLTWHYLFGLIAATGLRIGEALALTLDDITPDGLIIRDSKFRKSRMVAMHLTTREALNRYLAVRCKGNTPDGHLFVLATGRPPNSRQAGTAFRNLTEKTGIRKPGATRGPTPHSLRHSILGKGRRERELPLWTEVKTVLQQWLDVRPPVNNRYLFLNARGRAMSTDGVAYRLDLHVATAAKSMPSLNDKRITPHVIRHATAMGILHATGDIRSVSLWLGHADIKTTEVYLRASPAEKLEILNANTPPSIRSGTFPGAKNTLMSLLNGN